MNNWESTLISPGKTILEAIQRLDSGEMQITLVVNEKRELLGTVTDGDVRRGILRGVSLDNSISLVMNPNPVTMAPGDSLKTVQEEALRVHAKHVPILVDGILIGVESFGIFPNKTRMNNAVVLMAGGQGTRLRPLTDEVPKPMLNLGGRPILETIICKLKNQGFYKFFISVNYRAEVIENHFGNGEGLGIEIQYLKETKKMGTAGGLRLLPDNLKQPILVMNGDLLTTLSFTHLLRFHQEQKAVSTMAVIQYDFQVPFGVVNLKDYLITSIDEKPEHSFFVNAGIYVLEPEILSEIHGEGYFDMPTLLQNMSNQGSVVAAFPIREYWLDIGRRNDFDKASNDFIENFE